MSEEEKKLKDRWFTILWSFTVFNAAFTMISQIYFNPPMELFPLGVRYIIFTFLLAMVFGFGHLLYRCSCKKPGTKLLTFSLAMTAISMALLPIYGFFKIELFPFHLPYYKAFVILSQASGILWIWVTWKMRKINKKLRLAQS